MEYLDIVDEQDNIIGRDTKENKYKKGFISRNVAIFIVDKDQKILIGKRSAQKKVFPNLYDVSVAGNVQRGESYLEAAQREVQEELGIICSLKLLGKKFNHFNSPSLTTKYITSLFLGFLDSFNDEIKQNDELIELKHFSVEEIKQLLKENPQQFTSAFASEFALVRKELEKEN